MLDKYIKNVITFNKIIKVLEAKDTLMDYDLLKQGIDSWKDARTFMTSHFVHCQKCQTYRDVQVHHLDKNRKNNKVTNFSFLCKSCHEHVHHFSIRREVYILDLQGWTKFQQSGFQNISNYDYKDKEKIFKRLLEVCQN